MQPKKRVVSEKSAENSPDHPANGDETVAATQSRVGRPRSSPLDRKGQLKENLRAYRARLKALGLEKVETHLPKAWHQFLHDSGEPLQQLGLQAFALLLKERGAADLVRAAQPPVANESEPS